MRWIWIIFVLTALAACGGGGGGSGGGGTVVDPRLARLDAYEAQRLRVLGNPGLGVMGMPETDAAMVPTMGTATYAGGATIRVETTAPLVLYGDATLSVDFGGAAVTGQMDAFFGTTADGSVANYTGEIAVTATAATQGMVVDYNGALSGGSDTLGFDGTADAVFLGGAAEALVLSDLDAQVIIGGIANDATLVVVTEAAGPPE